MSVEISFWYESDCRSMVNLSFFFVVWLGLEDKRKSYGLFMLGNLKRGLYFYFNNKFEISLLYRRG